MSDIHSKRKAWLTGLYGRFSDRDKVLLERASRMLAENTSGSLTDRAFNILEVSRWDKELAYKQAFAFCGSSELNNLHLFPWACTEVHKRTKDDEFLKKVYPSFKEQENFWFSLSANGAKPVSLNCQLLLLYRALQYIAETLGDKADVPAYKIKESVLAEEIKNKLWDEKNKCYADFAGEGVLSPVSFLPLFTGIASKERAKRMAELALGSSNGEYRFLDVFFMVKGLKEYGFDEVADKMKENMLNLSMGNKDTFYEYYDTKTGKGKGAKGYCNTAVIIIELILGYH